jgi:hypothetical protein
MRYAVIAALSFAAAPAFAFDAEFGVDCGAGPAACQAAFSSVVKNASAALSYKALGPSEATGLTGIGIGATVSYVPADDKGAWRTLTGEGVDGIGTAGVIVHKGLPFGIDLGAFYSTVPGAGVDVFGGEIRYAILEGGVATPGVAVRANYTTTSGLDDFDYDSWGLDLSVSKGFAFATPYAGVGYTKASADPTSANAQAAGLSKVSPDYGRFFAGLRLSVLLLQLTPEYAREGDNDVYSLRLGLSF